MLERTAVNKYSLTRCTDNWGARRRWRAFTRAGKGGDLSIGIGDGAPGEEVGEIPVKVIEPPVPDGARRRSWLSRFLRWAGARR